MSLLDRGGRAVKVTPAGRVFLAEARRILRLAEESTLAVRRIPTGTGGNSPCSALNRYWRDVSSIAAMPEATTPRPKKVSDQSWSRRAVEVAIRPHCCNPWTILAVPDIVNPTN